MSALPFLFKLLFILYIKPLLIYYLSQYAPIPPAGLEMKRHEG